MGYVSRGEQSRAEKSRATRKGSDRRRKGEVSRPEAAFLSLCRHHLAGPLRFGAISSVRSFS